MLWLWCLWCRHWCSGAANVKSDWRHRADSCFGKGWEHRQTKVPTVLSALHLPLWETRALPWDPPRPLPWNFSLRKPSSVQGRAMPRDLPVVAAGAVLGQMTLAHSGAARRGDLPALLPGLVVGGAQEWGHQTDHRGALLRVRLSGNINPNILCAPRPPTQ